MCRSVLPVCMHICTCVLVWCQQRSERDSDPLGVRVGCEPPSGCWELNLWPLPGQAALWTTELSVLHFFLIWNRVSLCSPGSPETQRSACPCRHLPSVRITCTSEHNCITFMSWSRLWYFKSIYQAQSLSLPSKQDLKLSASSSAPCLPYCHVSLHDDDGNWKQAPN